MLQQDYLMRMFLQLASSIRESIERARGGEDPETAALRLDATLEDATEMDGALLLRMAPESMAAMVKLSDPDPALMGYVARCLLLSSRFIGQAGNDAQAALRAGQAHALAAAFGFEIDEADMDPAALEAFFAETLPHAKA